MNKLVIFDLDGTLLHTLPDIVESVNDTMRKFSYPELSDKTIMTYIGNGAKVLIERCVGTDMGQEKFNEILNYYNEIYTNSDSAFTRIFDGVDKLLVDLKKDGYKIAILTNKPMQTTEKVYAKYLKQFNFDMVVGASDKVKCKPDKEAAEYIMKELNVTADNTFMVGDGDTDAMLANNAGLYGVSVLWGYREKEKLSLAGAKCFANTPKELYEIITSKR